MAGYWLKYGNAALNRNGFAVGEKSYDPYNPLGLPPYTIRAKFSSGRSPSEGDSQTLVDAGENVWDITYSNTDWTYFFHYESTGLIEILGANTSGVVNLSRLFQGCERLRSVAIFDTSSVTCFASTFADCLRLNTVAELPTQSATDTSGMFSGCRALTSVPLFDTGNVTDMSWMFGGCNALTSVPLFDTGKATNMAWMFRNCNSVQSGALALYQQASTQANPPAEHTGTFYNCGSSTVTGAAELAQIPTSWGGTMQ